MNTQPQLLRVNPDSRERAHAVADLARYLNQFTSERDTWAIAGPASLSALTHGDFTPGAVHIIASGSAFLSAIDDCRPGSEASSLTLLENARRAITKFPMQLDAAWTQDRILPERPEPARAFRFALAHSRHVLLAGAPSEQPVLVPILQPFDAYIVALAQMLDQPRRSAQRLIAADTAFALYQQLGGDQIQEQLRAISFLCAGSRALRAANGVRRGDHDAFVYWHDSFMRERSPHATPSQQTKSLFARVRDWSAGCDLDQPDSLGR